MQKVCANQIWKLLSPECCMIACSGQLEAFMVKEQKISIIHDIATRSPGLFLGMVIKFIKKGKEK